jgi:hypothetical protein
MLGFIPRSATRNKVKVSCIRRVEYFARLLAFLVRSHLAHNKSDARVVSIDNL